MAKRFAVIHGTSGTDILVPADSVNEVAGRLNLGASADRPARIIDLRAVVSSLRNLGLGSADVIVLMLNRQIGYHRTSPRTTDGNSQFPYIFDAEAFEQFCTSARRGRPMSLKAAATDLFWNQQTVRSMLHLGEIRKIRQEHRYKTVLISPEEVARAKRDYITTSQVSTRLVTYAPLGLLRMLARELRHLGLKPVVGDGGAAARRGQLVWRSVDIDGLNQGALSAWARRFKSTRKAKSAVVPQGVV